MVSSYSALPNLNPLHLLPQSLQSALSTYLPSAIAPSPPPSALHSWYQQVYSQISAPFVAAWTTTMGALMSVPMLSFLLIPTMSSYSTSLNLLFFWLTWTTLVLSHPPLRVEIFGSLAVRFFFFILPSLLFILFDTVLPSAAKGFKSLGTRSLPLPEKRSSRSARIRVLKIASWSLFNILLTLALQSLIELVLVRVLHVRSALRVTTTLPLPLQILKDLLRSFLLREALSYTIHRYILHTPNTYGVFYSIAKLHRKWYHSLPAPFPLTAHYDHPYPYLLHKFLPTYLPASLFRLHLLTYLLFLLLISLEETFAYSGYSTVPTNFILGGIARRTDAHVLCGGDGNFAPLGVVDWCMGTSVDGDIIDDVRAEAEKHDWEGKAGNGMARTRKKGNEVLETVKRRGGGRKKLVDDSGDYDD